mgnify:CR=1 FL=1
MADIQFVGHGGNVIGSLSSGSMVQDMPSAMVFNGTTTHASSSATWTGLNGATDFAVTWWQKRDTNQNARVINAQGTGGETLYIRFDGSGDASDVEFQANLTTTDVFVGAGTSGDFASDGTEWQHYACTYDGTNAYMYRNGVQIGTAAAAGTVVNATSALYIGSYHSGGTPRDPHFDGSLRDMRIFTSGLTATQVTSVFEDTNMNGIGVTPVNWYFMEEGTGDTLNDSGSANIDLGIVSGSWDASMYNLNQIGAADVSGSVTLSGGTWNLRDSTYLDFDGTDDKVEDTSASSMPTTKGTLSCWFNSDDLSSEMTLVDIFDASDSSNQRALLYYHGSGELRFIVAGTLVASYAYSASELAANQWHQYTATYNTTDDEYKIYLDGELKTTSTTTASDNSGIDTIRVGSDKGNSYDFNGQIKDVMIYDSVLTDAQINLLHKSQWVGSPVTWWKFNEGTGNATDSGTASNTGTVTNATWVNPDCKVAGDSPGNILIASGAVFSAPRGNAIWPGQKLDASGAGVSTDWYVHNSGNFMTYPNSGGGGDFYLTQQNLGTTHGGPSFYNFTSSGNANLRSSMTFINKLECKASPSTIYFDANGAANSDPIYITLGDDTNQCTVVQDASGSPRITTRASNTRRLILSGASKLKPAKFTNQELDWADRRGSYGIEIGNLLFEENVTTGGGTGAGVKLKAIDDLKFEGTFLLESDGSVGDTLDLNGQRAEFVGTLDMQSTSPTTFVGSGALLICEDKIKTDNATVYNSGTSVICSHAGTSTVRFNDGDWENFMYNPTGGGVSFDTNANVANNLMIAGGYYDMTTTHLSGDGVGKLQIAGGAEFRGGDSTTHTITDTFNMGGGLLGTSALEFNGSSESAANASATTWGFGSSFTMELWFKTSFNGSSCLLDMAESSGNDNRIQVLQTASEMAFKLWNSGGSSFQIGTTAFTINPDDGKWHHLAFTTDGSTQKIYYDGKLAGEASHTIARDADPTMKLTIGMHSTLGSHYAGKMDELRFFSNDRTEDKIRKDMFQGGALADETGLVARYKFDEGTGTDIDNENAGTDVAARDLVASGDGVWIAPGTFNYETCTLKFDKAGTCYLYGEQDGTATDLYSLTVTNGTTLESFCEGNDFIINSGATLVNSGTLNSNRNWQYKSPNMPIVGASSNLKVGNNIFYYFPPAVSGAATEYRSFQPGNGVDLYMQGDFTAYSLYPYSDSKIHFNGYKGTIGYAGVTSYASGNVILEPGSSMHLNDSSLRGFYQNAGGANSYITASGEACAIFPGDSTGAGVVDEIDLPAGVLESLPQSTLSISMWVNIKDDDLGTYSGIFGGTPGKQFSIWRQSNNRLMFAIGGSSEQFSIFPTVTSGDWFHIGMTYDGSTVKGYYNGTQTGSTSYAGAWTTSVSVIGNYAPGGGNTLDGKIADVRIFPTTLSDANFATLASENPATSVSGAYADPTNSLGAIAWYKLGATPSGTLDVSNFGTSGATFNGSIDGTVTSGFVAISGNAGFGAINRPYEKMTLTNTYISGMADIVVGQTSQGANANSSLITKGTVVLE